MRKEKIYSLSSLYRENMDIYGYRFGKGEKAACIVGAMRGNEIQQMFKRIRRTGIDRKWQ